MGATSIVLLLGGQGDIALRTHERRANVVGQARQIALELALLGGALALALVGGIQRAVHRAGQIGEPRPGHFGGQAAVGAPVASSQEAGHTTKLVAVQQHHREPAERQASKQMASVTTFLSFTPKSVAEQTPCLPESLIR